MKRFNDRRLCQRQGFLLRMRLSNGIELWRTVLEDGQVVWRALAGDRLVAEYRGPASAAGARAGGHIERDYAAVDQMSFAEWRQAVRNLAGTNDADMGCMLLSLDVSSS